MEGLSRVFQELMGTYLPNVDPRATALLPLSIDELMGSAGLQANGLSGEVAFLPLRMFPGQATLAPLPQLHGYIQTSDGLIISELLARTTGLTGRAYDPPQRGFIWES